MSYKDAFENMVLWTGGWRGTSGRLMQHLSVLSEVFSGFQRAHEEKQPYPLSLLFSLCCMLNFPGKTVRQICLLGAVLHFSYWAQ